jgi:predicted dehydrogenase
MKIALVGVGGMGNVHFNVYKGMTDIEFVAACDIRMDMLKEKVGDYPIRLYADMDEMLQAEKPDMVDLCTPTYMHVEQAVKAMEFGCHVLSEKPMALNSEDCETLLAAIKRTGKRYMTAQVVRFMNAYKYLRGVIESGKYGKLESLAMQRVSATPIWSWDNWMMDEKRSGLVPFDLHIHDLDFMVYAFGKPTVNYQYGSKLPKQDFISVSYDFGDFSINCESSWYAARYPFTAEFRFQFEKAIVAWEKGEMKIYTEDDEPINLTNEAEGDTGNINLPKSDAYANELIYFKNCVKNNLPVEMVKADELECVLKILNNL